MIYVCGNNILSGVGSHMQQLWATGWYTIHGDFPSFTRIILLTAQDPKKKRWFSTVNVISFICLVNAYKISSTKWLYIRPLVRKLCNCWTTTTSSQTTATSSQTTTTSSQTTTTSSQTTIFTIVEKGHAHCTMSTVYMYTVQYWLGDFFLLWTSVTFSCV